MKLSRVVAGGRYRLRAPTGVPGPPFTVVTVRSGRWRPRRGGEEGTVALYRGGRVLAARDDQEGAYLLADVDGVVTRGLVFRPAPAGDPPMLLAAEDVGQEWSERALHNLRIVASARASARVARGR